MEVLPGVRAVGHSVPAFISERDTKSESGEGLTIYYHFTGWKFNLTLQTLRNCSEKPALPGPLGTPLASIYIPSITSSSLHALHTPA